MTEPTRSLARALTIDETRVGVGVIVRDGERVLLGRRQGSHGAETWGLPGGHLEPGESVEACARRETLEETGLAVGHVARCGFSESLFEREARHYVTVFVEAHDVTGEPSRREPERCAEWRWVHWNALPEPLFAPLADLLAKDALSLAPTDITRARPDEIEQLEEGLWRYETRGDEAWLDARLHADFVEIGRSGRRYARGDFLPVAIAPFTATVPLPGFEARTIAPGCVQTTYDSELHDADGIELAHRSSIWIDVDGRWQLLYHQGTPFDRPSPIVDSSREGASTIDTSPGER